MADARYVLLNATGAMLCANLDTKDAKGERVALILMDREKTRELTEEEFKSREVQKLLRGGDLKDVSTIETRRKKEAAASLVGGRLRMPERPGPAFPPTRPPDGAPESRGNGR